MALTRLGPFEIVAPLGQGGMGTVFRARQEPFGRIVALKVLRSGNLGDSESERRFTREVELASALSHPHLVKVLDGGVIDDMSYIAMELVEGDTLLQVIEHCQVVPWPHAAALASRLCSALAYLHDQNILHRDVKPANTLLSFDGWVKLMDFGLAKWKEATVMTADGAVVGTLQFLPPEVIRGGAASVAGDLWPVGCMLYRMVCGVAHIEANSQSGWLKQLDEAVIVPVQERVPELPAPLAELIMQLLAREPEDRPKTAAEVEERLDDMLAELEDATWDQILTPDQAQILLGKKPRKSDTETPVAGEPVVQTPGSMAGVRMESASAVTTRLPARAESGSGRDSGVKALRTTGASTPPPGMRTSGAITPPPGLRTSGAITPPPGLRTSGAISPPPGLRTSGATPLPAGQRTPSAGVKRSARFSIAVTAPTQVRRPRARMVAAGVAAVAALLFGVKLFSRKPDPAAAVAEAQPSASVSVAPSPSASVASAASDIDAERQKSRLTGKGLMFERYLPRLKSGGKGGARAVEEIKPLTPLSLGDRPCPWVNWIELELWFADARRAAQPPRSPCAQQGPMEILSEKLFLNVLLRAKIGGADAAIVSLALEHVAEFPDDGRTWLTLGRLLELDNRPEAAKLAYGIALPRMKGVVMEHKGEFLGAAMGRALLVTPGHSLEREIWDTLTDKKEARRALRGLGVALGLEGRDRYEDILRAGLEHPVHSEICAWVLAEFLDEVRLKPGEARRILVEYLRRPGKGDLALEYLMQHMALRGMIDEAEKVVKKEHGHRWYAPFFAFLRGTPPTKLVFDGQPPRERFTRWEVFHQMENGNWGRAAAEADALNSYSHDGRDRARQVWVDLAGRPGAAKTALEGARDLLSRDAEPDDWIAATGALAFAEGQPLMERCLAATSSELRDYMRALWLTRCGRLEDGLNAYASACKVKLAAPLADLAEIPCRPLIDGVLGRPVPPPVLARARTMSGKVPARARALHESLLAGNTADARGHAKRLFEVFPTSPFAILCYAQLEAATGLTAEWPAVRARMFAAVRARGYSMWIMDGLRAADALAVKRGAARLPPAP